MYYTGEFSGLDEEGGATRALAGGQEHDFLFRGKRETNEFGGTENTLNTDVRAIQSQANGGRADLRGESSARCAGEGHRRPDPRDAEDAVYGRNGYSFGDCKLRVEYPRSSSKFSGPMAGGPRGRFGPPSRRSEFRVIVTGLPPTGSWQDLKDHMREAGDVCFADVQRDGEGVVEFLRREDMEYALRRLDRTEFRSHQGETAYIRVHEDRGSSWGRSRSRSRSRGRYSPPYQSRASPPPRYHSPPPRRAPFSRHSPSPPRHYR
ncbi:hypothetical protein GJAV_G00049520 [Gymnothorax javanicus]|nr:hypothetical protein GJAV_G00049520 [Gymnothorax javanicus]